jgi:hypothetical protein
MQAIRNGLDITSDCDVGKKRNNRQKLGMSNGRRQGTIVVSKTVNLVS